MKQSDTLQTIVTGLNFPEGPAFAPDGSLWAVELNGESLIRRQAGLLTRHRVGGAPNGIAIDASGRIWFCDAAQNAIRRFDPLTQQTVTVADAVNGKPLDKPNDLAFDAAGNVVFTCPGNSRQQPTGYACVLTPDGQIRTITTNKYFPNGLAFSPDGRQLILAETYRHRLWKGNWDPHTTTWTQAHVWAEIDGPKGPGGPDGMAFGEDGNLYVAIYGTGTIQVIDSAGRIAHKHTLPGQNPTNCAFDPSGRLGLVIAEAEHGQLLSLATATSGIALFNGLYQLNQNRHECRSV